MRGALILIAALVAACEPQPDKCVADSLVRPEWCVRICEGRSFEFTLWDERFGQRCGDCRCFDTP